MALRPFNRARPGPRTAEVPRWLRPKLDRGQLLDIDLAHHENIDGIHAGEQNVTLLWHLVEAVFTWSKVAELLKRDEAEMALQLEMAIRVVERYGREGVIAFDSLEYQVAVRGINVMNALARATDVATAMQAAAWSEQLAQALRERAHLAASPHASSADAMAQGLRLTAAAPLG
jgi:hypothetical protein